MRPAAAQESSVIAGLPGTRFLLALSGLAAAAAYFLFFHFAGTDDVAGFWIRWADSVLKYGLREGYRQAFTDYPPGLFILFKLAYATLAPMPQLFLVKGTIAWSVVAGMLVFGSWSRSLGWSVALAFALLLSSVILGYLDVLYLAPLLGSLWALQVRRVALASFWFTVAVALKWQPLIIAPFFFAHALGFSVEKAKSYRAWAAALGHIVAGAAGPVALCLLLVEPAMLWRSFSLATSHPALSLQGLNANWLIQLYLYAQQGGKNVHEITVSTDLLGMMRVFFYLCYGLVFAIFILRRRSFAEFVWFSCVGFLIYFLLNTGVHENHWFVPMVLAFVLVCDRSPHGQALACFLAVTANLNLLVFYGVEGGMLLKGSNMLFASGVLASINTFFGIWCLTGVIRFARSDWRLALAGLQGATVSAQDSAASS
ncbi:MAG: hypothetical protein ABIO94_07090 [Opitutaceae bacterium]